MKNFIVKYGTIVVNITAFITIISFTASSVSVFMHQGMINALMSLWLGIVSFVFIFFHIYLTISINENLIEIKEKIS